MFLMEFSTTSKTFLYEITHRKKTIIELAEGTGISSSYLYRAALPTDESGVKFPIEYLIPLMKSAKDFRILKHIAAQCGFVPQIQIPGQVRYRDLFFFEYPDDILFKFISKFTTLLFPEEVHSHFPCRHLYFCSNLVRQLTPVRYLENLIRQLVDNSITAVHYLTGLTDFFSRPPLRTQITIHNF